MSLPLTKAYLETQLRNFDADFLDKKYLQSIDVGIKKLETPTTDMLSSYQLIFTNPDGEEVTLGETIDIAKDYLVKSAEVKTCVEKDQPVAGYEVDDKYIDFTINSVEGSGHESHIYISFKELFQFDAGEGIIIKENKICVNYEKGLEITSDAKLAAKIGEGLKFDVDNAIALDYETENIDFSTSI